MDHFIYKDLLNIKCCISWVYGTNAVFYLTVIPNNDTNIDYMYHFEVTIAKLSQTALLLILYTSLFFGSLGTRRICELMFNLLWQTYLATLPFRQISTRPGSLQANHS